MGLVGGEETSEEGKLSSSDIRKHSLGSYRHVTVSHDCLQYLHAACISLEQFASAENEHFIDGKMEEKVKD